MPDNWYFFCPICESWQPHTEHVSVKNGFRVQKRGEQPHISYAICKACLKKIKAKKTARK